MRSTQMPRRSHQTASLLRWDKACAKAKGTPLSLRTLAGRPRSSRKPFKYDKGAVFPGRGKRFAGQQKPAGVIGDGERIAVLAIPEQELAFVIGAPRTDCHADPKRRTPGRSPLVLTSRKEHLDYLAGRLRGICQHVFVLKGGMGAKQRKQVAESSHLFPRTNHA